MTDIPSALNVASIAVGFVAGICFCVGAVTMKPSTIASASATIVGGNPALMRSLSAQRAQYIVGAVLLIVSFALQAAALLIRKDTPLPLPLCVQWPPVLLTSTFVLAGVLAYLGVRYATVLNHRASERELDKQIGE